MSLLRPALVLEAAPSHQRLLEEAAIHASCAPRSWRVGAPIPDPAPSIILGVLQRGQRRLPPEVTNLADQHLASVPLLLLSEDPLVRPRLLLAGGRLTVVEATSSSAAISEAIREVIAGVHRAEVAQQSPRTWRGRRWSATLLGADPAAILPVDGGLVAVVGQGDAVGAAKDLGGMAPACREPFAASRLMPTLLGRAGAAAVAVLLPAEAGPWSLARRGAATVSLLSHRRLPEVWNLPAGQDVRLLPSLRGDVLLAGTDLPELPDLVRAASDGAEALAAHVAEQVALSGRPAQALIVEVVR